MEHLTAFVLTLLAAADTITLEDFESEWEYYWWRAEVDQLLQSTQEALDGK